jgi:TonB family protein
MEHPSLPSQVSAAPGPSTSSIARRDSEHVLAQLRTSIRDSNLSLDAILDSIVQAAQRVAYADGAAIAMRQDNLVVCQARSGDMAPALGTELDADSHISGQCLRTGGTVRCDDTNNDPRVDAEACRSVGLRSVAVVPVGRKPAVSGVLEAFSALPNAFDDTKVEVLEELAKLVIAAQRRSAESVVQVASEKLANTRKRSLILAAVAVLVLSSWLVFKGKSNSHPLQPVGGPSASAVADRSSAGVLKPNSSPVEDPRSAKPNLSSPMVKASKREQDRFTGDVTVRKFAPAPASNRNASAYVPNGLRRPPAQNPDQAAETAPALSAGSTSFETAPGGPLFAASNNLPRAPKVSQGLSGGTIEQKVNPIYPSDWNGLAPVESQVLLRAVVAEDGTVHDLKVIRGHPLLARAAIQAVSQWRYRPYLLDGRPIRMTIEITLVFKRPSPGTHGDN